MKQSTKVLLPLGLLMAIVIPVAVKTLVLETDFFEADNNTSQYDYLQPYKVRPENAVNMPMVDGQSSINANSTQTPVTRVSAPMDNYHPKSYSSSTRKLKR